MSVAYFGIIFIFYFSTIDEDSTGEIQIGLILAVVFVSIFIAVAAIYKVKRGNGRLFTSRGGVTTGRMAPDSNALTVTTTASNTNVGYSASGI